MISRIVQKLTFFLAGLLAALTSSDMLADVKLDDYNIVWHKQSQNSSESMPCGGGDIGLNVWVEKGDVLFYLSRSGTFDENNAFLKLGRVRLKLSPNPFSQAEFRQELKLSEGGVEIQAGSGAGLATLRFWVDVFRPVVHVETKSAQPISVEAIYECWRVEDHVWANNEEADASRAFVDAPVKAVTRKDCVAFEQDTVTWYHRNREETLFDMTVTQQGLDSVKGQLWNPLKGLTFGGVMEGTGMKAAGTTQGTYASTPFVGWRLLSERPINQHELRVTLHVATVGGVEEWSRGLRALRQEAKSGEAGAEAATREWWKGFWDRSHVFINPASPDPSSPVWQVGRNYQVFRYQLGCNAYGDYPTKFNGGLFTFDPEHIVSSCRFSPDYRKWGGGTFTAQNQRLVYWPMLKSGDYDMLPSQLKFYVRPLRNAELRSEVYWGVKGASFTEQIEQFGLPVAFEYGWNRPASAPLGVEHNNWLEYLWDTSFEFCLMALDLEQHTGRDISEYVPMIESCLSFFDQYYRKAALLRGKQALDGNGKLILYPGSAAETYKMAYNATSTLAALNTVLTRTLALPKSYLTKESRERWSDMLRRLPALSFRDKEGHRTIAPAAAWARINNQEIPQLYPVYPWGLYGVGKPDLQVAIDTWKYGIDASRQKNHISWHQDAIFCARLGLVEEAAELTIKKLRDSERRFPTYWGPGHDWVPDHNWGGSGMIGVQEMLMQTDGKRILLFPAWPKNWDVNFKLHAPFGTIVEGELREGRIVTLKTTPAERAKDIEMMLRP